jgi:pimeloyl-ACP methyl ester carboxylesterase
MRLLPWLLAGVLTAALAGCSCGIGVRHVGEAPLLADLQASAIDNGELSPRTLQTLRQLDFDTLFHRSPSETVARLHTLALRDEQPEYLFALAELCYHLGRTAERHDDPEAVACYYLCAGYAYHYLFKSGPLGSATAFDPRFRLACDVYNLGLTKCLRTAQRGGRLDPRGTLTLPGAGGPLALAVSHHGFAWRADEFGPLLFCGDFEVVGLADHVHGYGLGVPLIGSRAGTSDAAPGHAFYPREVSFPATAFLRFDGSLADLGARAAGRLELHNPLAERAVEIAGRPVPLETDLTTPLAYFLSRTDLDRFEYTGFLRADYLRDRTGIYLFEPYQPGKIPVLMVHGLMSSPVTWAPLFNELRADPELNRRYQFWFYRYPTGNPYLLTAADLRQSLDRLRDELDPEHRDAALEQTVLVGHSMGGLVSKLLTLESSDAFWNLVSKQPFDRLKGSPDEREQVRRVFFFQPDPGVRRVIFLGTPHHGSKLSPSLPAQLLARLVRLPAKLHALTQDLARENPGLWVGEGEGGRIPTSIDLLSPGSPALELLASRPAPPRVAYHSIIGVLDGRDGDGVVPYTSAHIDGAASELVVPAEHTAVHHHPRAVLEVRRILHEHARSLGLTQGEIVPVSAPAPVTK